MHIYNQNDEIFESLKKLVYYPKISSTAQGIIEYHQICSLLMCDARNLPGCFPQWYPVGWSETRHLLLQNYQKTIQQSSSFHKQKTPAQTTHLLETHTHTHTHTQTRKHTHKHTHTNTHTLTYSTWLG